MENLNNLFKLNILMLILVGLFCSCQNSTIKECKIDEKTHVFGYLNDRDIEFYYDTISKNLIFNFNKENSTNRQEYYFDEFGTLVKKEGLNFFGEEESYFFDENNSLSEYRKSVRINKKKIGVQDFIRYKNGIIDKSKSHYFDFSIIDSIDNKYLVEFQYLGAFKVEKINILFNKFEFQIDELDDKNIIASSNENSFRFLVKKADIYDKEIHFFQINASVKYKDNGGLIKQVVGTKDSSEVQNIIVRKLRKDTKLGR